MRWGVFKPLSWREDEAGEEPGRENVAHPELGLWVQLESGSRRDQEKRGRVRVDTVEWKTPIVFTELEPKDYGATESRSPQQLGRSRAFG